MCLCVLCVCVEGSSLEGKCLNQTSERDDKSTLWFGPQRLTVGSKINNPALHRFLQAKCNHRRFLPGKHESALNPHGVWTSSLQSKTWSYGAVVKPPGEATQRWELRRSLPQKSPGPWTSCQIKLIFVLTFSIKVGG